MSQRFAEEIRLRRFNLDETGIATSLILGGDLPAPSDVVEAVHERTNGIPLHIEELLAVLDDDARADGRRIRDAHVPDTIGDAVLARLARLSDDARTLARAGAVIGRCFSPDVIAGILDRPLDTVEPTIQELVDNSILYPFDYIDEGYFDFRHQLLRDAIYGAVPPSEKRRFHAQAAEFVMALEASSIVHASRHYERAGLRPQAYPGRADGRPRSEPDRSAPGGVRALRAGDREHAGRSPGRRAGGPLQPVRPGRGRDRVQRRVHRRRRRARELYLEAERPIEAAEMLTLVGMRDSRGGASRETYSAYTEQAYAEVSALPPSAERDRSLAFLIGDRASNRLRGSDLAAARDDAIAARALAESVGDRETILECDLTLARIDIVDGRYETGLSDGMRAAREARDAGFESVGVTGYRNLGIMAARVMDPGAAKIAVAEGSEYADAIEQSHCRQMMACTLALLDWGAGQWDAADERARHELVDRGCQRGVNGSLDVIGLVAMGRGRLEEARRWLEESLASGRRMDEVEFILTPLWGLAEADLAGGDVDGAIARCEEGDRIAHETGERALFIPFVVTGARAYLAARRPKDAERWVEPRPSSTSRDGRRSPDRRQPWRGAGAPRGRIGLCCA